MKTQLKPKTNFALRLSTLILWLMLTSGCQGTDSETLTPQDAIKKNLTSSPWHLLSANVDAVDQSSVYKNMVITFSESTYTSSGGGGVWPPAGEWTFESANGASIQRDDGLMIGVDVTDNSLTMSFTWTKTTLSGGRAYSISGQHVLVFGH